MKKKILLPLLIMFLLCAAPVQAKGITGKVTTPSGDLMIVKNGRVKTGLFRFNGRMYYGRKDGTLSRDCLRVFGKGASARWYYFEHSGKAQRKDSAYIDIRSKNGTVRYIYVPGSGRTQRYNTRTQRYQNKVRGKWYDLGMQCWPYGLVDFEK